jgi:hypothetical protein
MGFSSGLSLHIIFQLQSLTKDSSCKSDFNTIISPVSWSHVQTLFLINEKEALQRSLCKVQFSEFFMSCKDILKIYTDQLEQSFCFEAFPRQQFGLLYEL